jgi:multidrug resistance efflux pump
MVFPRADGWVTIPKWLYTNNLPDEELQRVYVIEAKKKVAALRREKRELEAELARVTAALGPAEEFLADADAALQRYRAVRRPTVTEQERRLPAARLLPKP